MTYHFAAIETALAAGLDDDAPLTAVSPHAFISSVSDAIATMANATDVNSWRSSAWRLRGLAASSGTVRLIALTIEAAGARAGDPVVMSKLRNVLPACSRAAQPRGDA